MADDVFEFRDQNFGFPCLQSCLVSGPLANVPVSRFGVLKMSPQQEWFIKQETLDFDPVLTMNVLTKTKMLCRVSLNSVNYRL